MVQFTVSCVFEIVLVCYGRCCNGAYRGAVRCTVLVGVYEHACFAVWLCGDAVTRWCNIFHAIRTREWACARMNMGVT